MPIIIVTLLLIYLVRTGKRAEKMGLREYLVVFLVTLAQMAVLLEYVYTLESPPLY